MSTDNFPSVKIKLEVDVPLAGGGPPRIIESRERVDETRSLVIIQPGTGTPRVKARFQSSLGLYVICATGSYNGRHVFAQVYYPHLVPGVTDPPPSGCKWTRPVANQWEFSHNNNLELPVVALEQTNTLVAWEDNGTNYSAVFRDFIPYDAGMTECQSMGGSGGSGGSMPGSGMYAPAVATIPKIRLPLPPSLARFAGMSATWQLSMQGISDRQNQLGCANLNGNWALQFDYSQPHACRWIDPLPKGALGGSSGYWRLQFFLNEGYWFLDLVNQLDQAPGAWISYRRHESAWNPGSANEMVLVSDSGLCNLPQRLKLIPVA